MKLLKKFLPILLLMLFIPLIVFAENCDVDKVFIDSINIEKKIGNVEELSEATVSGKNINLNLSMSEVGDSIEYKAIVKNDSDDDFELDKNSFIINSDYIDYTLESEDNSNIIKANSSKTIYLKVKYKTKVPDEAFESGTYSDNKTMLLNLSFVQTVNVPNTLKNSKIGYGLLILFIIIILCFAITYYLNLNEKNHKKIMVLLLGLLVIIPTSVYALCKTYIKVDSKVVIVKNDLLSFKLSCTPEDEYYFYSGMTFKDWIRSDLYTGRISGRYDSLDECKNVWGENRGCALSSYYIYKVDYNNYYKNENDCKSTWDDGNEKCQQINSNFYTVSWNMYYDNLEECTSVHDSEECIAEGNEYYYPGKDFYDSQEECENNHGSDRCTLETNINVWRYTETEDYDFDTAEECENNSDGRSCIAVSTYSPQFVDNTSEHKIAVSGNDWASPNSIKFNYGERYYSEFSLDDRIQNITYECVDVCGGHCAECVSPDSGILSSGNKTIKAKDIKENDDIAYYDFDTNKIMIGKVNKVYIHKNATNFVKYTFSDGTYIDVTDYHPIYTKSGWKSYTNKNNYSKPKIGDLVKTNSGYKRLSKISPYNGKEDFYDFKVLSKNNKVINNYFVNGILAQASY